MLVLCVIPCDIPTRNPKQFQSRVYVFRIPEIEAFVRILRRILEDCRNTSEAQLFDVVVRHQSRLLKERLPSNGEDHH
jgi:hypothetical protein